MYFFLRVDTCNGYSRGVKLLILFSAKTYVMAFMIEFLPLLLVDQSKFEEPDPLSKFQN
jgi:hypothetical protein